jgi:hypothetical protein
MMRKLFLILFLTLSIGVVNSVDLSIQLNTDKSEYVEGEEIKLELNVVNTNSYDVFGKLSGNSVIGNTGYDISCLEFNFVGSKTSSLQVLTAQAQMSTSNINVITSFSSCGGTQLQSTQTVVDNSKVISSASEEVIILPPFSLKYNFNGTDYDIKSNELKIKIRKKTEEEKKEEEEEQKEEKENQEKQEQKEQQEKEQREQQEKKQQEQKEQQQQQPGPESKTESENSEQNSDDEQDELPKGEELSPEKQQALKNNQQNQQSLSQLKNEISKIAVNDSKFSKQNLSFQNLSLNQSLELLSENESKELEGERKNFLWSVIGFSILFLALYLIYVKYFRKEDLFTDATKVEDVLVPYYLELLDLVLVQKDYKNRVKVLAQSVREFLFVSCDLKFVPTNNVGLKITRNKIFTDILQRAERIEFARSSDELNIKELIISLRKIYIKYNNEKVKSLNGENKDE